jgi:hypothetical protein
MDGAGAGLQSMEELERRSVEVEFQRAGGGGGVVGWMTPATPSTVSC